MSEIAENLGTRPLRPLPEARFVDAGQVLAEAERARAEDGRARSVGSPPHFGPAPTVRPPGAVEVWLVNPPAPDGARSVWIRSQHRVGRRSRENMIWPQVDLAQLAALLLPDYTVEIVDAIAVQMSWKTFEQLLREKRPRYYVTQVTAPTLNNDMYGALLARSLGARTIAFGTHVTPLPVATMEAFPALDFVLRGEPELTLRELIDTLEVEDGRWAEGEGPRRDLELGARLEKMFIAADPGWRPVLSGEGTQDAPRATQYATRIPDLSAIKGLVWRSGDGQIRVNADRPYICELDDLPLPRHDLLPWDRYRAPTIRGPYTFIVTSRGCPAGCTFCIKHASYGYGVRVRSAENVLAELRLLWAMGLRNVHMYADLFTVSREQVMGICEGMIREGLAFKWTCNSRVDYVDPEMLATMARAGCWLISWGIESANAEVRRRAHKGTSDEQIARALAWSRAAGIKNWGYFILGLPGESEETIRETIALSKKLPLALALFHIAAPYPGTPFFAEVVEKGWFRPGTAWEEVDMDESTVLDYPGLPAERIEYWARRAFREWALRPGPLWTFVKSMNSWAAVRSAANAGWQALGWMR